MPQGAASPGRMFPGVQIQQNGPWIRSRCAAASSVEETEHSRIMENESSFHVLGTKLLPFLFFHRVLLFILYPQLCLQQVQQARRVLADALDTLDTFPQLCDLGCDRRTPCFIIG